MATTATPSVAAYGKVLPRGDNNHPSLDQELNSFLKYFSSQHDESAAIATTGNGILADSAASFGNASSLQQKQPPTALTLRQWMIMKRSNLDGNNNAIMSLDGGSRSSSHSSPLPDLHLIPPAIIAMENILIRFKDNATMIGQPKSMVSWKTKAVLIMYPSRHI